MSLILSIETATQVCSVALHQAGKPVAHTTFFAHRSHSECLMLLIDNLLRTAGLKQKALAAVALSKGPGSYTGLRIGASVAKGLCYGLGIPLIGIPTLAAMVEGMRAMVDASTLLCPTIDARRNAVYTLVAQATGQVERATHVALLDQETYIQSIPNQPMLFFGDGALKCKHWMGARDHIRFVAAGLPSALHIGELAFPMFQQAAWEKIEHYEPYYLSQFAPIETKNQNHTQPMHKSNFPKQFGFVKNNP